MTSSPPGSPTPARTRACWSGAAPTGRVITWDAMTFRRFDEEGQVVERWIIGDDIGLLHQLGLV